MVTEDRTLNVMSFNIRCATGKSQPGDPDYWPGREPVVRQFLARERPHLIGFQELMEHQIPAVRNNPAVRYGFIGRSRNSSDPKGEWCALLYDTDRLQLREWDQ